MKKETLSKLVALTAVIFFLAPAAKAQSGSTTLNVVISQALSLTVNQASTDILYSTPSDYVNGVTKQQTGHLTVTSTTPYHINVKAAATNLTGTQGSIPASAIRVEAASGQSGIGSTTTRQLSTTDAEIISAAPAVIGKNINIKYSTQGGDTNFLGLADGTYSVQVTYTAVAE